MITDYQRANLAKLAAGLRTLPNDDPGFNMGLFHTASNYTTKKHPCGSAACAVGWAPALGIGKIEPEEDWGDYADRELADSLSDEWLWMFCSHWYYTDNTPHGAAARIEWYLEHGLPDDWEEQIFGDAPLCYKEPAQ